MRTALVLSVLAIGIGIGLVALNWTTVGPVVQSRWARLTGEFGAGVPSKVATADAPEDTATAGVSTTDAPTANSAPVRPRERLKRRSPSESVRKALGMGPDGRLQRRPPPPTAAAHSADALVGQVPGAAPATVLATPLEAAPAQAPAPARTSDLAAAATAGNAEAVAAANAAMTQAIEAEAAAAALAAETETVAAPVSDRETAATRAVEAANAAMTQAIEAEAAAAALAAETETAAAPVKDRETAATRAVDAANAAMTQAIEAEAAAALDAESETMAAPASDRETAAARMSNRETAAAAQAVEAANAAMTRAIEAEAAAAARAAEAETAAAPVGDRDTAATRAVEAANAAMTQAIEAERAAGASVAETETAAAPVNDRETAAAQAAEAANAAMTQAIEAERAAAAAARAAEAEIAVTTPATGDTTAAAGPEAEGAPDPAGPSPDSTLPGDSEQTAERSLRALTDAPVEVLEKAPQRILAETLSEAPVRALAQLPIETVREIALALPLPAPLVDSLAPRAPLSITTTTSTEPQAAVSRKEGSALVMGTGERQLPAPIALAPPPSIADIEAGERLGAGLAARTGRAASGVPAGAGKMSQKQLPTPLEMVLNASPEALERVPKRVLADALARLAPADMDRLSPALAAVLPAAIEEAQAEVVIDKQAVAFIAELTAERRQPIAATLADHFVRRGQLVSLGPPPASRLGTAAQLLQAPDIQLDTPLRVARIERALEPLDPSKLVAAHRGDLSQPVQLMENDVLTEVPLHVALERHRLAPERRLEVVREVKFYEPTTLAQLQAGGQLPADAQLEVLTDTPERPEALVEELLGLHRTSDPDSLYYIRTVREADVQGVWGIIQSGLIDNFARGMAVRRGEAIDAYQVTIPRDADELLSDASSSFLGRLIHRKMSESTVYNIREGRMSRNPNLIRPGQQIVIVDFSPAELTDIYRHFVKLGRG